MGTEEQPAAGPDLISVRRGSSASHGAAVLIFSFGVFGYAFISVWMLGVYVVDRDQRLFAPTVTLPLDTALALLGLCATVLIALVASLWASGQVSDAALSRGRRRALMVVTFATGVGSVMVGTAGALHRPAEGWNFITITVIFCLGLVLAYITGDVMMLMIEDRSLDEALKRHDAEERRARLRVARRNWLQVSRRAEWKRGRHPGLDRFRQTGVVALLLVALLVAALAALGGRSAVAGYLGWSCLDVAVGLLTGQLAAHFFAIRFVARRWEALSWYSMYALMYLLVSVLAQLRLLVSMETDLPAGAPGNVLRFVFGLACCLVPPLICVFGLTVVPRRWSRFRPLAQIRWSVISAISHEIERIDKIVDSSTVQPDQRSRLMVAIRRANGSEEIEPGGR